MRLTLNDVAREAGVSTATADRVLNNRTGVRDRTREIVIDAARRLGYISDTWSSATEDSTPAVIQPQLHFVLPRGSNMFVQTLQQQLQAQSAARGEQTYTSHRLKDLTRTPWPAPWPNSKDARTGSA